MELGQRIRMCRQELGLSQRQLCGEVITRNMLSLIESGAARPSIDTLSYLAARLGKPVGYFLEENAVTSPNQEVMTRAREAFAAGDSAGVRRLLQQYRGEDGLFDWERWLLDSISAMALAEQALEEKRLPYALRLLEEAAQSGAQTPYYSEEWERRRLLLLTRIQPEAAKRLPSLSRELITLAEAVLEEDPARAGKLLDAVQERDSRWNYLRGRVYLSAGEYTRAAEHLRLSEEEIPEALPLLEQCGIAMEDYKMAYAYACRQKPRN